MVIMMDWGRLMTDRSTDRVSYKTRILFGLCCIGFYTVSSDGIDRWAKHYSIGFESMVEGCLPYRAYLIKKDTRNAQRHDLVFFSSKGMQPIARDGLPVGKVVMGVTGDTVRILNGSLFINGKYLATLKYGSERLGKPINYWDKTYTIPEGKVFVFGTEKRSWDSRYWGLYDVSGIKANIRPLF